MGFLTDSGWHKGENETGKETKDRESVRVTSDNTSVEQLHHIKRLNSAFGILA